MATINAVIRKDKINKEGITTVQIAVRHHQQTAYIPTDIKVQASNFLSGMMVKGKNSNATNAQIAAELNKYLDRLNKVENVDAKSASQLKTVLSYDRVQKFHKVSECFNAYIDTLKSQGSKDSYITSQKCLNEFCKEHDINIESIDCNWVQSYDKWLHETTPFRTQNNQQGFRKTLQEAKIGRDHYSQSTISTYLAHLKAVINWCIREEWVTYRTHPFSKTEILSGTIRQNHITPEDFKRIKDYHSTNPRYREAHDMFLLSFYLGGCNLADILTFDFRKDKLTYSRQKIAVRTHGTIQVTVPILPEARKIASYYMDKEGRIFQNKNKRHLTSDYNYSIKVVAHEAGVVNWQDVTFTSARKAFAQIGTNLGYNDNYLNYLLGHSMSKARGMMYPYSNTDEELGSEILKSIILMSDHPERIKEVFLQNIKKLQQTIQ